MEAKVIQVNDLDIIKSNHKGNCFKRIILAKNDVDSDLCMLNEAYLEPNDSFEAHSHDSMEEIFYFIEGKGKFFIDNKEIIITPGTCIYLPSKTRHHCIAIEKIKFLCFGVALTDRTTN